ncbi:MAG: S-adenosylmethionine:tRNA ribosyltransferase-isomerase [Polyangiaceae bacterium]
MIPARAPRARRAEGKLLVLDVARARIDDRALGELPALLDPEDLLVVNDAATLPASLRGRAGQAPIELRLLARALDGSWRAVLFGAGDWTTPTERRPAPPVLAAGDRLELGELVARIEAVAPESARLVRVRFASEGARFWSALYRAGKPVQYSYLERPLELWDVQTSYAARPWAVEAPSAGFPLTGGVLAALQRRGVRLATLTHAAGLSATGDAALDALLPLGERFEIPAPTVSAIERAHARGARVIAAGTSVVRALEGRALEGAGILQPGAGETTLRIGPGYRRRVVDALLSGMHEPAESHYALLQAFAPRALLDQARSSAEAWDYRGHEFGDACLIV